jgi:hypothetical protein
LINQELEQVILLVNINMVSEHCKSGLLLLSVKLQMELEPNFGAIFNFNKKIVLISYTIFVTYSSGYVTVSMEGIVDWGVRGIGDWVSL